MELSSRADGHLLALLHQGLVVILIPFSVFYSGPTGIRTNRRQPTLGSKNLPLSVSDFSTERVSGWDGREKPFGMGCARVSSVGDPRATTHITSPLSGRPECCCCCRWLCRGPTKPRACQLQVVVRHVPFGRLAWCGLTRRSLAVLERVGSGVVLFGARLLSDVLGVVHKLGTSLCLSLSLDESGSCREARYLGPLRTRCGVSRDQG